RARPDARAARGAARARCRRRRGRRGVVAARERGRRRRRGHPHPGRRGSRCRRRREAGMSPELAMWLAIVGGGVAVYVIKLVGHLLPEHWLAEPRVARTAALVTVALLAALVAIQTFASGHGLTVDARLPALVV